MRLPRFELIEPRSLSEALTFLSEHGSEAKVLAGGTDILVAMKNRTTTPR